MNAAILDVMHRRWASRGSGCTSARGYCRERSRSCGRSSFVSMCNKRMQSRVRCAYRRPSNHHLPTQRTTSVVRGRHSFLYRSSVHAGAWCKEEYQASFSQRGFA